MRRSISRNRRGQTSYLVIVMMTLMMSFTLGGVGHVRMSAHRGRALPLEARKDRLMANAVQEIRISGRWTDTACLIAGETCAYLWRWDHQDGVLLHGIEAGFPRRKGWARPAGLFIETEEYLLQINDYRMK